MSEPTKVNDRIPILEPRVLSPEEVVLLEHPLFRAQPPTPRHLTAGEQRVMDAAVKRTLRMTRLKPEQVEWVVNDIAELGVKIGNQFFWLYKGGSLVYDRDLIHDETCGPLAGRRMKWRYVYKREFGECCHPWDFIERHTGERRLPDDFTIAYGDPDDWRDMPDPPTP